MLDNEKELQETIKEYKNADEVKKKILGTINYMLFIYNYVKLFVLIY